MVSVSVYFQEVELVACRLRNDAALVVDKKVFVRRADWFLLLQYPGEINKKSDEIYSNTHG